MNLLLIGSGGREHALAWKLSASPLCDRLFIAPGNPGTAACGENVALDVADHAAVVTFCRDRAIDLVVVGPEAPLVAGLVDDLAEAGIKAFGPRKAAAQLEGSKAFTKELCREFGIPTAAFARFTDEAAARAHVREAGAPIVVKADGLAAGKGVVVAETVREAEEAIAMMFGGGLGAAGTEVVIEECLVGEEASFFAIADGKTAIPLASAQDHKRVFDGDRGPNTGGMGAYSPAPVMTPALEREVMERIILPTVAGLAARGTPYVGVLYAGLMITAQGPKLIEYNARFGDPECQVLMPRMKSDLVPVMLAACDGMLSDVDVRWWDDAALTVVMATKGYPGAVEKGSVIRGIAEAEALDDVIVFHAGTKDDGGRIVANGGRVLNITATGRTVKEAQTRAYEAVARIDWPEGFCRSDIGWRAVAREEKA
ncbi:phosphoribosylamine--glycine ligase [Chelatococcus composti]|jgi:phosphoribosylamine--glycine ligase|uniref:Phosphoribosylamine--glycine ligase n=1 Tax=Chelatococcus composti TaxID=1743235 RepID=A0A841KCC9_9HYPH|nr:phosphoribosylamine--glycine ligase [Chelatococcus composti]MBB6168574.1 phosphoribosylamine--glycine ligase [Chelatococcus composti]MBS7736347.1 phosphoribosylamine--glycine ligase [Chelatococcus composti]PZN46021.1 MAG: phosphoribosylamine--glycine ligase [Pseudomonadota bacterium]GGG41115.1 phosphoribosylamine--glycine ligase [Chelatococcus composti]